MTETTEHSRRAVTVRELELDPDKTVHGVTCDGAGRVWFAEGEGDLVCLDPATGRILRRFERMQACAGTTFDGTHLWQIVGERIVRIEPGTGAIERSIPAPAGVHCSGMAWAEGALWIGDFDGPGIVKVDAQTGAVERRLVADRFVTGIAWNGEELWHGCWDAADEPAQTSVRRVDPESGAVLEELRFDDAFGVSGLAADEEGRLWCGGGFAGGLRAVRRE